MSWFIVLHEVCMEEQFLSVGEEGCQGIGWKVWVGGGKG